MKRVLSVKKVYHYEVVPRLCEKCASPMRYTFHEKLAIKAWYCPLCHPELEGVKL